MKNKYIKILLFIVLIFNICMIDVYATSEGATDDELKKMESSRGQISNIQAAQKRVKNTISSLQKLKDDTQKYIEELDKNLNALTDELNNTLISIDVKQAEIDVTNELLDVAKKDEEKQYHDMKLRIKFFYENDNSSILESILTGKNLQDILTKTEYLNNLTEYDRKKLDELVETKEKIIEFEKQLQLEKNELIILKDTEIDQKNAIEALIDEKTKELQDTKNKINTSNAELKKLQNEQKKLENEIASIEKAILARGNSKRVLSGGLIWPCPDSHKVTSGFGKRSAPTKGASTNHQGIDISAKTGTKVVSAAKGEVVIAKYSYSAGNYVMIDHGSGIFTVYMHLSKISVSVGQEVAQGAKVGEVGSTGYATGPHLHFGVRKNGSYVNPLTYVG